MTNNGHADTETEYGRLIVQYDFGRFYIFINTPEPDYTDWSMTIYDGDVKRSWGGGMRKILFPDQLRYPSPRVEVTSGNGETWSTDLGPLLVEAYQEVEGEGERPIPPNFEEMSDEEIVSYVEGDDNAMEHSDLSAVRDFVDQGYISKDQATALLNEWMKDNL